MAPVLARIIMRYLSGALVAYGVIPHDVGADLAINPDIALVVGATIAAITEAVYAIAKRKGGAT